MWFVYSNVLHIKCVGLFKNVLSLIGYIYEEHTSAVLKGEFTQKLKFDVYLLTPRASKM